ncbi:MAG: acetylglutamate kinase [Methanobacteriota archaeon]|nr:MAG: acetylglutamate kinase [Euryarchaeota archaeon]
MNRAEVLTEALPYIEEFHGSYVVIKYGGHAMLNEELKDTTIRDTILLKYVGMKPIIVHGGGPEITAAMEKFGKKPEFIEGLRVTDEETMDITKMVLVGKINTDIVSRINKFGSKGAGLSGKDGGLIIGVKRPAQRVTRDGVEQEVDMGLVGEVKRINPEILQILTERDYIPVVSPVAMSEEGTSLNINSDTVAGEIATAIGARKLIILTDVDGVLRDVKDKDSLIKRISPDEAEKLISEGVVRGSMIPKIRACTTALKGGVEKTHIINGGIKHSILLEIFTDQGIGTMIWNKDDSRI